MVFYGLADCSQLTYRRRGAAVGAEPCICKSRACDPVLLHHVPPPLSSRVLRTKASHMLFFRLLSYFLRRTASFVSILDAWLHLFLAGAREQRRSRKVAKGRKGREGRKGKRQASRGSSRRTAALSESLASVPTSSPWRCREAAEGKRTGLAGGGRSLGRVAGRKEGACMAVAAVPAAATIPTAAAAAVAIGSELSRSE